jgi:hypothetical protein
LELNYNSLINISSGSFDFNNLEVNYTSSNSGKQKEKEKEKEKRYNNAYENICFIQNSYYPSFYINSSNGTISNITFDNSQTGAILLIDSNITVSLSTFRNNIIRSSTLLNYDLYLNLRFNIYVDGNEFRYRRIVLDFECWKWDYWRR